MASNRFFTIMVVPEKTQNVRRVIIPNYVFKGGVLIGAFLLVLATVMVLDYANVMHQISENKQLRTENRQLKQEVQVFKDKMLTVENTLDRVKTFATKLRIITNIEDRGGPMSAPTAPLLPGPASAPGIPGTSSQNSTPLNHEIDEEDDDVGITANAPSRAPLITPDTKQYSSQPAAPQQRLKDVLAGSMETVVFIEGDTSVFVKTEFERLYKGYDILLSQTNAEEREIQEIYEQLSDKKSMLQSMPTMTPTDGYITSGFGVRFSPYGGRRKMHEGIDIANRYGSDIVAPGDGLVQFAGVKPGYGKILTIDHGYGLQTYFGHTAAFYVRAGDRVKRGQRIAAVGSTGRSTGPHLHYEIHAHSTPIDPMYYLLDR